MSHVQRHMEGLKNSSLKETLFGNGGRTVFCYGLVVIVRLSCPCCLYDPLPFLISQLARGKAFYGA